METVTNTMPKLERVASGIDGLDEITSGGLPKGRSTLVAGGPGSGKTLLALQFLVGGIRGSEEPGIFVSFELAPDDVRLDAASVGFPLEDLERDGSLVLLDMRVDASQVQEMGAFDLSGLFVRLERAISAIGAKRIAIDTIEMLFGSFQNQTVLRSEVRRLFEWLKNQGVTAIVTAETGEGSLTKQGIEEYVSDCVIALDHRVTDQIATRRLRVVKYRGSNHGTWEFPFLIGDGGLTIAPITSLNLDYEVPREQVSSGVEELDEMLGGGGFYRGSTVLISGEAGCGKSSLAAHFVEAATKRGEKALYFAFEESPDQIVRNMRSVGIDLGVHIDEGLLRIEAARPAMHGVEHHLVHMYKLTEEFSPRVIVLDPITDFEAIGSDAETKALMTRMVDFMKSRQITGVMTSMTWGKTGSDVGISSLVDTWIQLRNVESDGERNRVLHILKSRGMSHSNKVREFLLTDVGVNLVDVHVGATGVLVGSARRRDQSHVDGDAR